MSIVWVSEVEHSEWKIMGFVVKRFRKPPGLTRPGQNGTFHAQGSTRKGRRSTNVHGVIRVTTKNAIIKTQDSAFGSFQQVKNGGGGGQGRDLVFFFSGSQEILQVLGSKKCPQGIFPARQDSENHKEQGIFQTPIISLV